MLVRNHLAINHVLIFAVADSAQENYIHALCGKILAQELAQAVPQSFLVVACLLIPALQKFHRAVGVDIQHRVKNFLILLE